MLFKLLSGDVPFLSGTFRTIALIVTSISAFVFVALFGRLPVFSVFIQLDQRLTGRRVTHSVRRSINYIMNEPHPIVMVFFILLQLGSEILFLPPAVPYLSPFPHYFLLPVLISFPYYTLFKTYKTKSSVTPTNHRAALQAYPYDYILYHPNQICHTCKIAKPARSKHCSICKTCVQRQDHHCVWINNCVGRNNHVWFCALLLSISLLIMYGAMLGYGILDTILQERFVPRELTRGSHSAKRWATRMTWTEYLDAWALAINLQTRIGAVTLLAFMTSPLALGFLLYHIYLLWAGVTTNESNKWGYLREDIDDGLVWKGRLDEMTSEYPVRIFDDAYYVDPGRAAWKGRQAEWWVIRTRDGLQPVRKRRPVPSSTINPHNHDNGGYDFVHDQMDGGLSFAGVDGELISSSDHHHSGNNNNNNNNDDNDNNNHASRSRNQRHDQNQHQEQDLDEFDDRWIKVRNLRRDLDNVYDMGFWENMQDSFFNTG